MKINDNIPYFTGIIRGQCQNCVINKRITSRFSVVKTVIVWIHGYPWRLGVMAIETRSENKIGLCTNEELCVSIEIMVVCIKLIINTRRSRKMTLQTGQGGGGGYSDC